MRRKYSIIFFVFLLFAGENFAQSNHDSIPVRSENTFSFSGNADIYFRYGFNETASSTAPSYDHGVNLGWINFIMEKKWKKVDLVVDLVAGPRADQFYKKEGQENIFAFIKQGFVSYSPFKKLKLYAGSMTTPFNIEYLEPATNFVYTNSYTNTIIAASFTGFKAEYIFNDSWTASFGVYCDPDKKIDPNRGKHFIGTLIYAGDKFKHTADFLSGKDGDTTAVFMADVYGIIGVSAKLNLGYQLHYTSDKPDRTNQKSQWLGTVIYAQYMVSNNFSIGSFIERFRDTDGYFFGSAENTVWCFTLACKYKVMQGLTLLPELRMDTADKASFNHKTKGLIKNESAFLLAALYEF